MRWPMLAAAIVCLAGGVALTAATAAAELESRPFNFNPTTGLINIPIAATAAPGEVDLAVGGASLDDRKDDQAWLRVGVEPGVEFALNHVASDAATLNAQFLVAKTDEFSAALGVQNLLGRRPGVQEEQGQGKILDPAAYVVVTRPLTGRLRAHYGLGSGRFGNFFGGFDYQAARRLQVMAEWDGQEMNAGVGWTLHRNLGSDGSGFEVKLTGAYLDLSEPSLQLELSFRP